MGTGFEITPAHAAIFAAIKDKKRNLIVEAVAGSGKTSTMVEAASLFSAHEATIFLAFNKHIATELARRLPPRMEARTMNALGHRALTREIQDRIGGWPKVDADKTFRKVIPALVEEDRVSQEDAKFLGACASRLVRLAKAAGFAPPMSDQPKTLPVVTVDVWEALIDRYDVDVPDVKDGEKRAIVLAERALRRGVDMLDVIDFDDQIYLTVLLGASCFKYDRIIVDEAQDLSPLQHELLARSLKQGGQLVAVGDPRQAIYAWRGADANSMTTLAERFSAQTLPLHVSYRCPRHVVSLAQTVVEHIRPHANAPIGIVDPKPQDTENADIRPGDLVMCRMNAPIVGLAYRLLRKGVRVEVLGRDIGKGLLSLVKKLDAVSVDDLLDRLENWRNHETEKATKKGRDNTIATVNDKAYTLTVIAEEAKSLEEITRTIQTLFSSDDATETKVTLCTVHKAKGLEADRVWILDHSLMPMRTRQAWQAEGELCVMYVAYTRAKRDLRFLGSGGPTWTPPATQPTTEQAKA